MLVAAGLLDGWILIALWLFIVISILLFGDLAIIWLVSLIACVWCLCIRLLYVYCGCCVSTLVVDALLIVLYIVVSFIEGFPDYMVWLFVFVNL